MAFDSGNAVTIDFIGARPPARQVEGALTIRPLCGDFAASRFPIPADQDRPSHDTILIFR
jgi:hypothetical protein